MWTAPACQCLTIWALCYSTLVVVMVPEIIATLESLMGGIWVTTLICTSRLKFYFPTRCSVSSRAAERLNTNRLTSGAPSSSCICSTELTYPSRYSVTAFFGSFISFLVDFMELRGFTAGLRGLTNPVQHNEPTGVGVATFARDDEWSERLTISRRGKPQRPFETTVTCCSLSI